MLSVSKFWRTLFNLRFVFVLLLVSAVLLLSSPVAHSQENDLPIVSYLITNGGFEEGGSSYPVTGWTFSSINGGAGRPVTEGECHSANNTKGIKLSGDFAAKLRPSADAPIDSVAILTSDPFWAGNTITFSALSENSNLNPVADPTTLEVRVLDAETGEILYQDPDVDTNVVTLESSAPGCTSGEDRNGEFSQHTIPTDSLIFQRVQLQFRQHTNAGGWGFFTLIDDVTVSGIILKDSDSDGLLDDWEINGYTETINGETKFVDLPAMGADPNQKDIFVQLDWMVDDDHNHRLDPEALRLVVEAFANHDINLHIDHGPQSILNFNNQATWGEHSQARPLDHENYLGFRIGDFNYQWGDFNEFKNADSLPLECWWQIGKLKKNIQEVANEPIRSSG